MGDRWFCVRTKQAREITAACSITAEGFRTFYPVELVEVSHAGKRERKERPLFPRYIFAQFDPEITPFGKINFCRGVASKGLMCDAMDRPIPIPDSIIMGIREREALERAKAGEVTTGWRPGDKFQHTISRTASVEATYIGEERGIVFATIQMFGQPHLIEIPYENVPAKIFFDRKAG